MVAVLETNRVRPQALAPAATAVMARPDLRVLTLTTLYPSAANPRHGIFVETRLRKLRALGAVDLQVVAPVPWFPLAWRGAGRYAVFAATPHIEARDGVTVRHPRFVVVPKFGLSLQPRSLAGAFARAERELSGVGWSCHVIDAHYLYPDGVAAAEVAARICKPFVVTARGSDVNLIARLPGPRRRILAAMERAERVITVSAALKQELVKLGARGDRIEVLRNGVDMQVFRYGERETTRARLGAGDAPLIVSVGNLVPEKGHALAIAAVAGLAQAYLVIVGSGPERERLRRYADGLGARVQFLENVPQRDLAMIYSAADALVLASTREGWPNVLLEAMACGTPVVAADVGGVREIVDPDLGAIVADRDPAQFTAALRDVVYRGLERAKVRSYAERFAWEPIATRYLEILSEAAGSAPPRGAEA